MVNCEECEKNFIFKGFVKDKKFICDDCIEKGEKDDKH